jgi:hypothetical protein
VSALRASTLAIIEEEIEIMNENVFQIFKFYNLRVETPPIIFIFRG